MRTAPVIGAVLNIILCIIDNSSPSISVALVAGIQMGKERDIYQVGRNVHKGGGKGEECLHL